MKKIISLFQRDYDGDRLVMPLIVEGAEWVRNGEGVATRKFDGTCCMIRGGKLFKRYDVKKGKSPPEGFEPAQDPDATTGHWPGWVPVTDGPQDRWHREAMSPHFEDGTYELCGPMINGNPEGLSTHLLIRHGEFTFTGEPRTFYELREWLPAQNIEGLVWHHPDGRMVKIKTKDFGLKRGGE